MMDPEIAQELSQRQLTRWHLDALSWNRRRLESSDAYWSQRHTRYRECERLLRAFREPDLDDEQTRDDTRTEGVEKIVVPYNYAIVETMRAFCMGAIQQRVPTIPVEAPGPSKVLPAMLMEQCLDVQSRRMPMPLLLALSQNFLDGFRYGIGITKTLWSVDEMPTVVRKQVPVTDPMTGNVISMEEQVVQQNVTRYEGNVVVPVSPFEFFPDHRRTLGDFQNGEYCGQHFTLSWTELRQRQAQGLYVGVEYIPRTRVETQEGGSPYGMGGPTSSDLAKIMDQSWIDRSSVDERGRPYADMHEMWAYVTNLKDMDYRAELDDPPDTTPARLYVFTIANMARIVRVEEALLPALRFPFEVFEPNFDIHSPSNHGVIEVMRGLQYFYSWLFNSRMTSVRRTLNNEMVYDPSMIVERDILDPEPGRLIRVSRDHWGEGRAKDAVWPIPVQDTTAGHLQDAAAVRGMIQEVLGIPNMMMGMASSGRRPATEMQQVMKSATGRLGLLLMTWSTQYAEFLARQMSKNTQMFLDCSEPMELKQPFRDAIGLPWIQMRPDLLEGDFLFPWLGIGLPTDKAQEAPIWKEFLMAGLQANPQMMQMFPWQTIITRWFRAMGIKDLQTFGGLGQGSWAQMAPIEQVQREVEKGNLVPAQSPLGAIRTGSNGQMGGYTMPNYESVPGVGANGLGRA